MTTIELDETGRIIRGRYCDGTYVQTGRTTDGDEFDDWLDAMMEGGRQGRREGRV